MPSMDGPIFCQIVVIFRLCQISVKWWEGAHYPQLLLNDSIDFSENFRHPFTHITDVHLLFCYWVF